MLPRMEAWRRRSQIPTGWRPLWRRPPFTVPRGRRPTFWRSPTARLRAVAPGLAITSGWAALSVRGFVEIGWMHNNDEDVRRLIAAMASAI